MALEWLMVFWSFGFLEFQSCHRGIFRSVKTLENRGVADGCSLGKSDHSCKECSPALGRARSAVISAWSFSGLQGWSRRPHSSLWSRPVSVTTVHSRETFRRILGSGRLRGEGDAGETGEEDEDRFHFRERLVSGKKLRQGAGVGGRKVESGTAGEP